MSHARPDQIASPTALNEVATQLGWPMLCDESCDFSSPVLSDLLVLWRAEAGAGIPQRDTLTARKLQPFMRNIAIYERMGDAGHRRYRVRLMGSGIVQYYGEMTGKYLDEVVPVPFLPRWYPLPDLVLSVGAPVRLLAREDTFDKSYLVGEHFCAPLAAGNGVLKHVLVGIVFEGRRPWSVVEAEARQRLGLGQPN